MFDLLRNCRPQWLPRFMFPSAVCELSKFYISSSTKNKTKSETLFLWKKYIILVSMKWHLILALICVSLVDGRVERTSHACWPCVALSFRKYLWVPCPFLNLFVFLLVSSKSSLHILDTRLLTGIWFANIFSHSVGCLFAFLVLKVFNFYEV